MRAGGWPGKASSGIIASTGASSSSSSSPGSRMRRSSRSSSGASAGRDQQRQDQRDRGVALRLRRDRRRGGHRGFDDRRRPGLARPEPAQLLELLGEGFLGRFVAGFGRLLWAVSVAIVWSMLRIGAGGPGLGDGPGEGVGDARGFDRIRVLGGDREESLCCRGLVGATEMWPSRPLAAEAGNPRMRAARRPTTVVVDQGLRFADVRVGLIWFARAGSTRRRSPAR